MIKRLNESRNFRLQQETKASNGRKFYRIVYYHWQNISVDDEEAIRDIVDPQRNKSGRNGSSWKFSNRKEAEYYYTMLLLRWA